MKQLKDVSILTIILTILAGYSGAISQPVRIMNSAEIELALQKLRVLGSALYIAAHPDDENTAVLAYLSKEKLVRTAYLSLTRGEGGQNLIGSETGDALGALRTEELLSARRIDGATQFFTSATDFGYSKSISETLKIWNHDRILGEMVRIIRTFRPDVIITRFTESQGGHGHHLTSAKLAREAFKAAADPQMFPEQLTDLAPWQTKRIVWNAWSSNAKKQEEGQTQLISVDVGKYNPLLGMSYTEIAALSRSMHKSQGFGVSADRGPSLNYFQHLDGLPARIDLFDDVDTSWRQVKQAAAMDSILAELVESFDARAPYKIIGPLMEIRADLRHMKPDFWIDEKIKEIDSIIQSCSGLWLEIIADTFYVSPSDSLDLKIKCLNRSPEVFVMKKYRPPFKTKWIEVDQELLQDSPFQESHRILIAADQRFTSPSWLENAGYNDWENYAEFVIETHGQEIPYKIPLLYRWTDRVKGEMYRHVDIGPPLDIELMGSAIVFTNQGSKAVTVSVKSQVDSISGILSLQLPDEWKCSPNKIEFSLTGSSPSGVFEFFITPPADASTGRITAIVQSEKRIYDRGLQVITYDHIDAETIFPRASADLVHINVQKYGSRIGYIMGSGDEIPQSLEQISYQVDLLSDQQLADADLSQYDAIVAGTRAYNVRESLKTYHTKLMNYVRSGGTLITLHNTRFGLPAENTGPYPFQISRIRVSDENAPVKFLDKEHPLLNTPNKITTADFDHWIQERGLYFATDWDNRYTTLFATNDPEEEPHQGAFLYTQYGKGHFIYSSFAWFRQLPAGVGGAYRMFANMLSIGNKDK